MSRYITCFFNATIERQQELVELHNVRTYNNDAISIDSTDTAFQEYDKVTMGEVMKIAFRQWRYMPIASKKAWGLRADRLNARKLPGWLVSIPPQISNVNVVMESISLEWEALRKVFKEAIERAPAKNGLIPQSNLIYTFGSERVEMKSQTYKTFSITLLLKYYLFGEDFDKVRNEVRKQTKNITLLHFLSMQRMQEIFTVEEQIGTSFQYEHDDFDATRTCGGKVSVVDSNGKKGVGFILEERRNFWKIKLKNTSEVCYLKKLLYNEENEMYDFNGFHDYQGRTIMLI